LPGGSDEPGTSLVGPDWAVAALTIILGRLRPIYFDSCLMGTVILVPDSWFLRPVLAELATNHSRNATFNHQG
jgi:hypothetical protein